MQLNKQSAIVMGGGNVGALTASMAAGFANGGMAITDPLQRGAVNIVSDIVIGVAGLAASEKVKNPSAKIALEGFGTAPLYNILTEVVKAAGVDPYTASYASGAQVASGVRVAPARVAAPAVSVASGAQVRSPSSSGGTIRVGL